jgi:hypothetical protein
MANTVKILLNNTPGAIANFDTFSITITNALLGFSKTITKTFISGNPSTIDQVKLVTGINSGSFYKFYLNLVEHNSDLNISFVYNTSATNPSIDIIFNPIADYAVAVQENANGKLIVNAVTTIADAPYILAPLAVQDVAIEIIDTYTNTTMLVEEFTAANSPKLEWNGGDDLRAVFMTSKLTFNMIVKDAEDAKFLHLFTGDEQRYKVKVSSVDDAEVFTLIWQGYLLPDQYTEPWTGAAFFVEFTAVDMVASLKGKYFEPWYYPNRFPIAELIAEILKLTGLEQNLIVTPSIVPADPLLKWENIIVPIEQYFDGKKYSDVYQILQDVLEANCLTLYSYRGYWFIEGFSRKKDTQVLASEFDGAGRFYQTINYTKKSKQYIHSEGSVNFTGITPFVNVFVDSNSKGDKNLLSDEVVRIDNVFTVQNSQQIIWNPREFKDWIVNTDGNFAYRPSLNANRALKLFYQNHPINPIGTYNEATGIMNYFECPENPYLKKDVLYELEVQFEAFFGAGNIPLLKASLENGKLDNTLNFQIFVNNKEVLSNRPSFVISKKIDYERSNVSAYDFAIIGKFTLQYEFKLIESGFLKLRIIYPILMTGVGLEAPGTPYNIDIKKLKIKVVEDYDLSENVNAVRNINFTEKLEYNTKFNSSYDNSFVNNFGLGKPKNTDYLFEIDTTDSNPDYNGYYGNFDVNQNNLVTIKYWNIDLETYNRLFVDKFTKTFFFEKLSGEKKYFTSFLRYKPNDNYIVLGFINAFTGLEASLPKGLEAYVDYQSTDILKYMAILYDTENLSKRLSWKIYGTSEVLVYNKTVAKLLHAIQPEPMFRLDTTVLDLVFPENLVSFLYNGQNKKFIPTTLTLDLFEGKTIVTATEAKFVELTDINYE